MTPSLLTTSVAFLNYDFFSAVYRVASKLGTNPNFTELWNMMMRLMIGSWRRASVSYILIEVVTTTSDGLSCIGVNQGDDCRNIGKTFPENYMS